MKKNILLAVFCLIISAISFAQVPQKMSYQAVVRGSDNNLVTNHQVAMRVSILQGSVDGTAVYTETHSATTNANGLLTIEIGDGTSNDDFTAINWANGPFFVKTETDVNGGDDYDIVGVSQLLSVPYAMYAQTAGNMPDVSGFLTEETDPTVPAWAKTETKPSYSYDEITGKPTNVSAFTNDANYVVNEADPTVPAWAKTETKPVYNYSEIENTPDLSGYITTESQTLADVTALDNSVNNSQIKNLADPTDAQDATTKKYVDDLIAALQAQNEALQETLSAVICNITFDANGGTGTMNPQTMVKGAAQAITTNTFTKTDYAFASWNTKADGSGTSYDDEASITISGNMTLYAQWRELRGTLNGYEWVDLGLPSGLLWATCNVGAASPEEYGNYYAWGETEPKETYNWSTYRYYDGSNVTKYTGSDNLAILEASDDAATANWGEGWRMPTQSEMQELYDNCTHEWTTQNGVNGRKFTGPNGNTIFLPAAGNHVDSGFVFAGSYGDYWSSSLDAGAPYRAWYLYFGSVYCDMGSYDRDYGRSVRPVCAQ